MDDEKLIVLIQAHACLYNVESHSYSDKHMKRNAWENIAAELDTTVENCQKQWKKLRDNYRKAVKARTDASGSAGGKRRPIKYDKELQFLRPFIQERQQVSNLDSSTEETTQSDQSTDVLSPRPQSELSTDVLSPRPQSELSTDVLSPRPQSELSTDVLSPRPQSELSTDVLSPRPQSELSTDVLSPRPQSELSTDVLSPRPQSELSNPSEPPHEPVSKPTELIKRFLSYKEQEQKDHILSFFITMATTVKTFPPYLQTKIKRDVFKIINDAEEQYQSIFYNNLDVNNTLYDLPATHLPSNVTQNTCPSSTQNYNTLATYESSNIIQNAYIPSTKNYNTTATSATYVPTRITTSTPTNNQFNETQINNTSENYE